MTAVERLTAAIEVLERIKADSTSGPWTFTAKKGAWGTLSLGQPNVADPSLDDAYDTEVTSWDGPLIATLHRTIDAQLAFLNHAVKFLGSVGRHTSSIAGPFIDDALALADAILGDVS